MYVTRYRRRDQTQVPLLQPVALRLEPSAVPNRIETVRGTLLELGLVLTDMDMLGPFGWRGQGDDTGTEPVPIRIQRALRQLEAHRVDLNVDGSVTIETLDALMVVFAGVRQNLAGFPIGPVLAEMLNDQIDPAGEGRSPLPPPRPEPAPEPQRTVAHDGGRRALDFGDV